MNYGSVTPTPLIARKLWSSGYIVSVTQPLTRCTFNRQTRLAGAFLPIHLFDFWRLRRPAGPLASWEPINARQLLMSLADVEALWAKNTTTTMTTRVPCRPERLIYPNVATFHRRGWARRSNWSVAATRCLTRITRINRLMNMHFAIKLRRRSWGRSALNRRARNLQPDEFCKIRLPRMREAKTHGGDVSRDVPVQFMQTYVRNVNWGNRSET